MNWTRNFGLVLLAILWVWLVQALFTRGGGITAKNIFLAVASAIIIFVPIYKKYSVSKKDPDKKQ